MCVPFLCTISFSSWSYHEPYLLKCFSTHFGLCLMYKNYTHGKKDTTRCREERQLVYEPALHGSFPPAFTAPVPVSIPPPQPCPHCGSVTWTTLLSTFWDFSSNSLTPWPCSLLYKLRCISSRASRIGCQAGFPSLGGCSASVELEHWFLSGMAFFLFYRNCYLLPWCS